MASQFAIQPAYKHEAYDVRYFPVQASQTFIVGALVVYDSASNKTISECGADPTTILGIALAPASAGLAAAGSIYGGTRIPVLIINPGGVFFMASSTTPVYATHVGIAYGVEKTTNWRVDVSDTSATRVRVEDVSPIASGPSTGVGPEGFIVKFIAANLQYSMVVS